MNDPQRTAAPAGSGDMHEGVGSALGVVTALTARLHAAGIVYCHWKSNEHLKAAVQGLTDLDVLVDRRASASLRGVLSDAGFKRFDAVPTRAYPAVEDHLAMDPQTGRLVHLHLHFQLVAGEPHLKGYRLPWEPLVLSTRRLDEEEGIYVADPHVELVLLIVRAALKIRSRDRVLEPLGRRYFSGGLLKEFQWLQERTLPGRVAAIARQLLGFEAGQLLGDMLARPPHSSQLAALRRSAGPTLDLFRTYGPTRARWRRSLRELSWLRSAVNKRFIHAPTPLSRVPASGGLLVAFLGCDGSGKSTQAREIVRWLSWKLDVFPVYFGSGDGPSSWFRWPLTLASRAFRKATGSNRSRSQVLAAGEPLGPDRHRRHAIAALRAIWALALAYEKRSKLHAAARARNRGMIVVCDRYPQQQVMGFNDGPLLSDWLNHSSRLLRAIARWEHQPYRLSELYPPDLVIKLRVTPEVALRRKRMHLDESHRRIDAVRRLSFPPPTRTVEIDADRPFAEVLLMVKRCIWREI
jgi:hypothetical protein